jgi:hypothetical protein
MYPTRAIDLLVEKLTRGAGVAVILFLCAMLAEGQEAGRRTSARDGVPRLPGAVTKAPAWLAADAPFDLAKFFQPVPRDQIAAPLYLDALFEFGSELEA